MLPTLRKNWPSFAGDEPLARLRNDVDSLFQRVFDGDGGFSSWSSVPLAMWDDEDHVYIEAEVPGVSENDVDVTVHNGMLFIRGESKPHNGPNYLYNGRSYGRFERVIALPAAVDADNVKAKLAHGLLHIELCKTPESKPKRIAIQAS